LLFAVAFQFLLCFVSGARIIIALIPRHIHANVALRVYLVLNCYACNSPHGAMRNGAGRRWIAPWRSSPGCHRKHLELRRSPRRSVPKPGRWTPHRTSGPSYG
jgi:hypothetical protein